MSSLNVLPSAPPEKLYPELLPDNFRLSRIGNIEKNKFLKESRTTEKSPTDRHALHCLRFGFSRGRSLDYWRRLEPYGPWDHCRCPFPLVSLLHRRL